MRNCQKRQSKPHRMISIWSIRLPITPQSPSRVSRTKTFPTWRSSRRIRSARRSLTLSLVLPKRIPGPTQSQATWSISPPNRTLRLIKRACSRSIRSKKSSMSFWDGHKSRLESLTTRMQLASYRRKWRLWKAGGLTSRRELRTEPPLSTTSSRSPMII